LYPNIEGYSEYPRLTIGQEFVDPSPNCLYTDLLKKYELKIYIFQKMFIKSRFFQGGGGQVPAQDMNLVQSTWDLVGVV
jgi:hypothetical protein